MHPNFRLHSQSWYYNANIPPNSQPLYSFFLCHENHIPPAIYQGRQPGLQIYVEDFFLQTTEARLRCYNVHMDKCFDFFNSQVVNNLSDTSVENIKHKELSCLGCTCHKFIISHFHNCDFGFDNMPDDMPSMSCVSSLCIFSLYKKRHCAVHMLLNHASTVGTIAREFSGGHERYLQFN